MIEQIERGPVPVHKSFKVQFKHDSTPLLLSSMFDSGNIEKLQIGPNNSLLITPGHDCSGTSYEGLAKGWFHFSVKALQTHPKIKFIVKKMTQLTSQTKISDYFKPVYRFQKQDWTRLQAARTITKQDDTELHIQFQFIKPATVYFAYTFPFSYEDCERHMEKLAQEAKKMKSIYYCDQVLIKSPEGRNVRLVTLSSVEGAMDEADMIEDAYLFPEGKYQTMSFGKEKRVVMISARVHPAEAPASHTFNGLIKFLLSKDARAYYLRSNFVFKLIPMLNPDGVAKGHYRMDVFCQNLNRFYQNPDPLLQPSAYAVKQVGKHYSSKQMLCFYMDLHAHPQKKGNFIYGNAMPTSQMQAETQLFAKILSLNSVQFDYGSSSFDSRHMTLKDKNEDLTKQGCGRVVFQRQFGLTYSYTMECGYTCSNILNQLAAIEKAHRKFDKHSILPDEMDNIKNPYYTGGKKAVYFTIQAYEALGKNVAVSLLDLFGLNPASRLPNTRYKTLSQVKKEILAQLQGGNSSYFIRKFANKPQSQQMIQSLNAQSKKGSKTINSFTNIQQKPFAETVSVEKKVILASSQFVFLQSKTLSDRIRHKKGEKQETAGKDKKARNATLPKVNLFKLNAMPKNVKLFTNAQVG